VPFDPDYYLSPIGNIKPAFVKLSSSRFDQTVSSVCNVTLGADDKPYQIQKYNADTYAICTANTTRKRNAATARMMKVSNSKKSAAASDGADGEGKEEQTYDNTEHVSVNSEEFMPAHRLYPIGHKILLHPVNSVLFTKTSVNRIIDYYALLMVGYKRCETAETSWLGFLGEPDASCPIGLFGVQRNPFKFVVYHARMLVPKDDRDNYILNYVMWVTFSFFLHVNDRYMEQVDESSSFVYEGLPESDKFQARPYSHALPHHLFLFTQYIDINGHIPRDSDRRLVRSYTDLVAVATTCTFSDLLLSVHEALRHFCPDLFNVVVPDSYFHNKINRSFINTLNTTQFTEMMLVTPVENISESDSGMPTYSHIGTLDEAVDAALTNAMPMGEAHTGFCHMAISKNDCCGANASGLKKVELAFTEAYMKRVRKGVVKGRYKTASDKNDYKLSITPCHFVQAFAGTCFGPNDAIFYLTDTELYEIRRCEADTTLLERYLMLMKSDVMDDREAEEVEARQNEFACRMALRLNRTLQAAIAVGLNDNFRERYSKKYRASFYGKAEHHPIMQPKHRLSVCNSVFKSANGLFYPPDSCYEFNYLSPHFMPVAAFVSMVRNGRCYADVVTESDNKKTHSFDADFLMRLYKGDERRIPREKAPFLTVREYSLMLRNLNVLERELEEIESGAAGPFTTLHPFHVYQILSCLLDREDDIMATLLFLCAPCRDYFEVRSGYLMSMAAEKVFDSLVAQSMYHYEYNKSKSKNLRVSSDPIARALHKCLKTHREKKTLDSWWEPAKCMERLSEFLSHDEVMELLKQNITSTTDRFIMQAKAVFGHASDQALMTGVCTDIIPFLCGLVAQQKGAPRSSVTLFWIHLMAALFDRYYEDAFAYCLRRNKSLVLQRSFETETKPLLVPLLRKFRDLQTFISAPQFKTMLESCSMDEVSSSSFLYTMINTLSVFSALSAKGGLVKVDEQVSTKLDTLSMRLHTVSTSMLPPISLDTKRSMIMSTAMIHLDRNTNIPPELLTDIETCIRAASPATTVTSKHKLAFIADALKADESKIVARMNAITTVFNARETTAVAAHGTFMRLLSTTLQSPHQTLQQITGYRYLYNLCSSTIQRVTDASSSSSSVQEPDEHENEFHFASDYDVLIKLHSEIRVVTDYHLGGAESQKK
jgi:hypothetical protein